VESLLKGQISSWAELGGPNIPVRIIIPPVMDQPVFRSFVSICKQYSYFINKRILSNIIYY